MCNLVRTKELINDETCASMLEPSAVCRFMLVVSKVRKAGRADILHTSVEEVTGKELGFIQIMLSVKRNTGLAVDKLAGVVPGP